MDYLKEFVADCQARGLTAHTIETYASSLKAFLEAYPEPGNVDMEALKAFLGSLCGKESLTAQP